MPRSRNERERVAKLLEAAERRQHDAWDKPAGVQARINQTVRRHRTRLAQLDREGKR